VYYPDTLVGTDSHTTMINGIGVVGWGVGGIEAEAAMLGQPVYFLTPDVVGLELTGQLREGVTATDLVLTVTESCASTRWWASSSSSLARARAPWRCPTAPPSATWRPNTAPPWASSRWTKNHRLLQGHGPHQGRDRSFEAYFKAQGCLACRWRARIDYSQVVKLDLGTSPPAWRPQAPAGPHRAGQGGAPVCRPVQQANADNGFNRRPSCCTRAPHARRREGGGWRHARKPTPMGAPALCGRDGANKPALATAHEEASAATLLPRAPSTVGNGDVLIAAITSCTNTSNPSVLLAAGLLAKKAVEAGLKVQPHIKTSLAPGSRIVTEYLTETGLLPYLEKLGFALAGYGCTTCIGNAGDLTPELNEAITSNDLVCAAVLSGNRNFEARIHPNLKANFLASPPLVVAYAIAGTVLRDLMTEPVGQGKGGKDIYLGDIWPSSDEIHALMKFAMKGKAFRENYAKVATDPGKLWKKIKGVAGTTYTWPASTYIAEPPFFANFASKKELLAQKGWALQAKTAK
jgi:aconitate hydratase